MSVLQKTFKSKNDWIEIAVLFYSSQSRGLTQREFARIHNLNYKTFNSAMNRYRSEIVKAIQNKISKNGSSAGIDVNSYIKKPKSISDQFVDSIVTNTKILSSKKSLQWFSTTLRKVLGGRDTRVGLNGLVSGKLYTYAYDPLTKHKLPYWDQYPLIIFLEFDYGKTTNRPYFRAINLHYLSPNERVHLMKTLLENNATTSNLMKNTRLNVSWEDFKYHPKNQEIIKNYLPTHIRSTIREIPPSDWYNIIQLPLQKFTNSDSMSDEELTQL